MVLSCAVGAQLALEGIFESLSNATGIVELIIVIADVEHVDVIGIDLGRSRIIA